MIVQNFFKRASNLRCGPSNSVGKYTPITDLGYQTAEERINAIMSAGQILKEARAEQHTYINQNPDEQYKENTDAPTIVYMDKMEAKETLDKLQDSKDKKVEAALNQLNKEEDSIKEQKAAEAYIDSNPEEALKLIES